jgi:hypothetical protein
MFLKFFNGRRLTVNFKCFAFSDQENFRKAMYLLQLMKKLNWSKILTGSLT